jgi:hypothetical protein
MQIVRMYHVCESGFSMALIQTLTLDILKSQASTPVFARHKSPSLVHKLALFTL